MASVWFHASKYPIADNESVLPRKQTGLPSTTWPDPVELAKAQQFGFARDDRVYVYSHASDDVNQHFGIGPWARREKYYYEVQPICLQDDPEPGSDTFKMCLAAVVKRCIYRPG